MPIPRDVASSRVLFGQVDPKVCLIPFHSPNDNSIPLLLAKEIETLDFSTNLDNMEGFYLAGNNDQGSVSFLLRIAQPLGVEPEEDEIVFNPNGQDVSSFWPTSQATDFPKLRAMDLCEISKFDVGGCLMVLKAMSHITKISLFGMVVGSCTIERWMKLEVEEGTWICPRLRSLRLAGCAFEDNEVSGFLRHRYSILGDGESRPLPLEEIIIGYRPQRNSTLRFGLSIGSYYPIKRRN